MLNLFGECPNLEAFSITCNACNAETYKIESSEFLNKENFGYKTFSNNITQIDLCTSCLNKTSALEIVELMKIQREKDLDVVRKFVKEKL